VNVLYSSLKQANVVSIFLSLWKLLLLNFIKTAYYSTIENESKTGSLYILYNLSK